MRIKAHQAAGYVEADEGDCVKLTFTSTVHTPVMGGGHLRNNHNAPRGDRRYREADRMKNRILRVAIAPNYRPSGSHDANVVYGGGGICPTITTQAAHSNAPLVAVPKVTE